MKNKILILLLLPLLALRCNNKDPEPEYYVRLSQDFKDYCVYPVGSWWVYEDSAGVEDSIWVIKSEIREENEPRQVEWLQYYEILSQQMQSNSKTYTYLTDVTSSHIDDNGDTIFLYMYREIFDAGGLSSTADRFKWEANNNYQLGDERLFHYTNYNKITINDIAYNDVIVFGHPEQSYGNQIHKEYFARGIGVVQREMFDGTIWKLKKYHIQ